LNHIRQRAATSGEKDLVTRIMGRFYTPKAVGQQLIASILQVIERENLPVFRIIDPFCGDGRLVCWLLEEMASFRNLNSHTLNIEMWDCDRSAIKSAAAKVSQIGMKLKLPLDINVREVDTFEHTPEHMGKFNIVITNSPWEVLKPDSRELKKLTSQEVQAYKNWLKTKDELLTKLYPLSQPLRKFSGWGTNLARCGTEVALRLTSPQGVCGLISPASLLADQMTEKLRRWILCEHNVHELAYYPAEARLFDRVDQSSITLVATPGKREQFSPLLTVYNRECQVKSRNILSLRWDELEANNLTLPVHFGGEQIKLLNKWRTLPRFGELEGTDSSQLWAGRELDETRHKRFLGEEGDYLFLKGRMIQRFEIIEKPSQYVKSDETKIPPSVDYYRIAWRDVSRSSQKRRLHATLIPPGWITGNSLHVTYFRDGNVKRLKALLAIMNSFVFEFQLRTYLATSHVSLGSVRKVRIPPLTEPKLVEKLACLVDQCLESSKDSQLEIEIQVAEAYGLNSDDFKLLLSAFDKLTSTEIQQLDGVWRGIQPWEEICQDIPLVQLPQEKKLPNHYTPSLSHLDLQMVEAVSPGGNWKNIPKSIPSKRLEQIRESYAAGEGSRSTYYGRLKPDAPSYTISTCFNRPGNGCHIHYDYENGQHRLISQREAARLQSFPDSFVFYGSRSAVNEQIGNAVPPLLAYQIAKHLGEPGIFVDLFAGAGGLALGFSWAGWHPVIANDIKQTAIETYTKNIDQSIVLGDIREEEVYTKVVLAAVAAKKANPHLKLFVLGGPPCQGFSTAGKARSMKDERNSLFQNYRQIVEAIQPDGFVFENVMGLLNMDKGNIFKLVHSALSSITNKLSVWKLNAENYGIPQRRKRLILVGRKEESKEILPPPRVCASTGEGLLILPPPITVSEALSDLPPLVPGQDGENLNYVKCPNSIYQSFVRGFISPREYIEKLSR
jgi:Alw26I/Eco31I/Esp3I family type II restriction m6 adenine DNA methyltransferase